MHVYVKRIIKMSIFYDIPPFHFQNFPVTILLLCLKKGAIKMRIKYFLSCISCCMIIMCGCTAKEVIPPSKVSALFLNAYHDRDEKLLETYSTLKNYSIDALSMQESDYIEGVDKTLQEELFHKMVEYDHKELDEQIQDDHAIVNIELTVYNFDQVKEAALQAAEQKATELSEQEAVSDADAQSQIMTVLYEQLLKAEQNKKITISLNLEKVKGTWLVSSDNVDLQTNLLQNLKILEN